MEKKRRVSARRDVERGQYAGCKDVVVRQMLQTNMGQVGEVLLVLSRKHRIGWDPCRIGGGKQQQQQRRGVFLSRLEAEWADRLVLRPAACRYGTCCQVEVRPMSLVICLSLRRVAGSESLSLGVVGIGARVRRWGMHWTEGVYVVKAFLPLSWFPLICDCK